MPIKRFIHNSCVVFLLVTGMFISIGTTAGTSSQIHTSQVFDADTLTDSVISYSPEPFQPVKVLFDAATDIVLKATKQIRIIAWIQDTRKSVPARNADKDNEMIVSIAYIINFKLK